MSDLPGRKQPPALSVQLADARKRGIERLDVESHNQHRLEVPGLDELAARYAAATRSRLRDRVPRLKYLLRDAIGAFSEEDETDAKLIRALFFGDSQNRVTKSAGELLDIAQKESDYTSAVRFRHARNAAFDRFADFLPRFVAAAGPGPVTEAEEPHGIAPEEEAGAPSIPVESAPSPDTQQLIASTGYIDNGEHFVTLLSLADSITVVGYTNESLASMLWLALNRKREAMLRPDSCWLSVRVVFLTDDLLDRVNDERVYPDPDEARVLRRRQAIFGRRTVRIFLRSLPDRTTWAIYDSPHFPPFTGTIFEMPDGKRVVHLIVRRPQRSGSNHLYLELEDTRGHYFSSVFNEIVDNAVNDDKMVPAGRPSGTERFRALTTRFRRQVLTDGRNAGDWLPMVLVITWQLRAGRAEPLLQLRTQRNSTRELHHFTHLAGHITQEEGQQPAEQEFGAGDQLPMAVAAQRVQMETGESGPVELTPVGTGRYFYPDKEHLFFFVYACRLPDDMQVWPKAEMSALSVPDLLAIRENQVLRKALLLCESPPTRRAARTAAFDIMAQNLILHDYPEIARQMTAARAVHYPHLNEITAELRPLEEATRGSWPTYEGEAGVLGLSGFQYREFFGPLLSFYKSVGVPGAAEQLKLIEDDEVKQAAANRLAVLYADQRLMESIAIELLPAVGRNLPFQL
jgi:hypothetical protein